MKLKSKSLLSLFWYQFISLVIYLFLFIFRFIFLLIYKLNQYIYIHCYYFDTSLSLPLRCIEQVDEIIDTGYQKACAEADRVSNECDRLIEETNSLAPAIMIVSV